MNTGKATDTSKTSVASDGQRVILKDTVSFSRIIPAPKSPGWYFISPDMTSDPPKVLANPYDPEIINEPVYLVDYECGEYNE